LKKTWILADKKAGKELLAVVKEKSSIISALVLITAASSVYLPTVMV
jgi:hypothetical protein